MGCASCFAQYVVRQVEKDVLEVGLAFDRAPAEALRQQVADQGGRRIERDDLAVVHDGDPVAEGLGFVRVMSGEDDGAPVLPDALSQLPEAASRLRIDPGRGFVQEKDLWLIHQGGRDREARLLAAAKGPEPAPRPL